MLQIFAAGNLGKDATLRSTGGRDNVCSFSVAIEVKGRGGAKQTYWLNCSLWGKRGETLQQYLTKGTKVAIQGALSTREYNGKTYLECKVNGLTLQGRAGGGGGGGGSSRYDGPPPDDNGPPAGGEEFGGGGDTFGGGSSSGDYGGGSDDDIPFAVSSYSTGERWWNP